MNDWKPPTEVALLSGGNPQIPNGDDTVFVSFRCFTKKVQIAFHNGASLDPEPPKSSKHPDVRYLDIVEEDELDELQLTSWFRQASQLPGEAM